MHELNVDDIDGQELEVQTETKERLGHVMKEQRDAINILSRFLYRKPKKTYVPPQNEYQTMVFYWLYMSIYTFKSSLVLVERGYYHEANILSRNLLEVFVKMRYFQKHPDKLAEEHRNNSKPETRGKAYIKFSTMFNEVLPGYYERYKWMFSEPAHGGVGALLFKAEIRSATDVEVDRGVIYDEDNATRILNGLNVYLLGYIRFYKHLYPEVIEDLLSDIRSELDSVEAILLERFESHIELKGQENDWHIDSRKIIEIK